MKLLQVMGWDEITTFILSAFVIFLGIATVRVGLYGKHLGRLKLVSYVQKYAEQPSRQHRFITAGIGVMFVLTGLAMLVLGFVLLKMRTDLQT